MSEVLGDDSGLASASVVHPVPTFGLSSCETGSVMPAPRGVDPVAPVGRTEADFGSASDAEVTSKWAPSS